MSTEVAAVPMPISGFFNCFDWDGFQTDGLSCDVPRGARLFSQGYGSAMLIRGKTSMMTTTF